MRILHTSDWHLGKCLETCQRLDEQKLFLDELVSIADDKHIDLIIVAGDVYDSVNPPAAAEQLFYASMKKLSDDGRRPILVIAGNHDSPDRLTAAAPLAVPQGVILLGTPKSVAPTGDFGNFSIPESGEGFVEIVIGGESAVILTLPYPNEKRLNEILSPSTDEKTFQYNYSQKIGEIFNNLSAKYRWDTINIATGHFYIAGGVTTKSERDIQLGGSYAVGPEALPDAQYIAMGHLHRPQRINCRAKHAYYSGSPIQYDKSESHYAKCVYVADIKPGQEAQVEKILLANYKPIEIWKAGSIEEAIKMCGDKSTENCWVYLEIITDRVLLQSEIKEMRTAKKDILAIEPLLTGTDALPAENYEEKGLEENFIEFYRSIRQAQPTGELVETFLRLCDGEDGI